MGVKSTQIDGDVSVGRNVHIGGDVNVQGSQHIKKNLVVDGWLHAPNIKYTALGLFSSLDKLKEFCPEPRPGYYAYVGENLPAELYIEEDGKWKDSGKQGGTPVLENLNYQELDSKIENEIKARESADATHSSLLQGKPDSITNNIRNPYTYLGSFKTWTEVQTELDKLHNTGGESGAGMPDDTKIGEFRALLDGRNLLVRNWVQNWATGVFTQTVEGSITWNGETMEQSLQTNAYERIYNGSSGWGIWQTDSSSSGNMILDWKTNTATTRKQVTQDERKAGMMISYKNASGEWINEQYVGTSFDDTSWAADANWQKIGASAIELAQELSTDEGSEKKAISQKIVSQEVESIKKILIKINGGMTDEEVEDVTKKISPTSNGAWIDEKGFVKTSTLSDYHIYSIFLKKGDTINVNALLYKSICRTNEQLTTYDPVVVNQEDISSEFTYTATEDGYILISTKGAYNSVSVDYSGIEKNMYDLYGDISSYTDVTDEINTAGYYPAPNTLQEGDTFQLNVTSDNATKCGIIDCSDCDGLIFKVYGNKGRFYHSIIFLNNENTIVYLPKEKSDYSGENFINVLFNIPKEATKCVINEYYTTALPFTLNFYVKKLVKPQNPIHNISIKFFGAKGDGINDDTDAIQMALSCGAASVYIPKGRYLTSRTIFIPTGVSVRGDGLNNSVIIASLPPSISSTNYTAIQYRDTDRLFPIFETERNSDGIVFDSIGIDATGYLSESSQYVAFSIHNTKNCKLINCGAKNINYDPVSRTDVTLHTIWGQSVYIFKSENVIVEGGEYLGGGYENIGTEQAKHVVIKNAFFGDAWRCSVQIHQSSEDIVFCNNRVVQECDKSQSIMMLHGRRDNLEVNHIYISSNYFYGRTNGTVEYRGGINNIYGNENDVHIVNNTIDVNHYAISDAGEGWGSNEDGSPKNWYIIGNTIKSSSYGILFARPQSEFIAQNIIIKNNVIDSVEKAIELKANNYIVKDNILFNNKTMNLAGTEYTE